MNAAERESISPAQTSPADEVSPSRQHDNTLDATLYDAIFGVAESPPEKTKPSPGGNRGKGASVKQTHGIVAQSSAIAISENTDIPTFPDPRSAAGRLLARLLLADVTSSGSKAERAAFEELRALGWPVWWLVAEDEGAPNAITLMVGEVTL